ncbi:hypothetical protein ACTXG6_40355 [Pseudonocardia sp. Cha107L01]|uniref:hypothetical protein n=1 Tax=Pseudonocardia sp. Cha107L01 TaxID=3457576 RepID=UPI00403E75BD
MSRLRPDRPSFVYVLCFDEPRCVTDGDVGGPVLHYVGVTRQDRPVNRAVKNHKARMLDLVYLAPGDERAEDDLKLNGRCPRCAGSLWYYLGDSSPSGRLQRDRASATPRQS